MKYLRWGPFLRLVEFLLTATLRNWGRDAPSAQPFAPVFHQATFKVLSPRGAQRPAMLRHDGKVNFTMLRAGRRP